MKELVVCLFALGQTVCALQKNHGSCLYFRSISNLKSPLLFSVLFHLLHIISTTFFIAHFCVCREPFFHLHLLRKHNLKYSCLDCILKKRQELGSLLTWHSWNLKMAIKKKNNKTKKPTNNSLPPTFILTQLFYPVKLVGFVNVYWIYNIVFHLLISEVSYRTDQDHYPIAAGKRLKRF